MRVDPSKTNSANNTGPSSEVASSKRPDRAAAATKAKSSDGTKGASPAQSEISAQGRDMAKAQAAAKNAPDVREEKIQKIRERIAQGRYKVDADAVADKLVDDHIKMSGMS